MGAPARTPRPERRSDSAPRASDPDVSEQRVCPRGSTCVGAREGRDPEVMKRRDFVGRMGGWAAGAWLAHLPGRPSAHRPVSPSLLVPMDDALTRSLQYAGISFTKIWDAEVTNGSLKDFDWLHLHHEDFTGQYSKFFLIYSGMSWLAEMVHRNTDMARRLGFATVPDLKKA